MTIKRLIRISPPVILVGLPWLFMLILWETIRLFSEKYSSLIPSVAGVINQAILMFADGSLLGHWLASTLRVTIGVVIGVILAIPAGFLLGWNPVLRKVFTPVLNFFRSLPPIALIPLLIIYFGIGEPAKILVLAYTSFFISTVVLYEGISNIQPIYIHAGRTLGATDHELFNKIVLPLALPHVLTASRLALGSGWMTLVASELISAQQGLGSMIQVAASYFQLETIYLGLICIGLTAMLMDFLLVRLSQRLVGWQEKVK